MMETTLCLIKRYELSLYNFFLKHMGTKSHAKDLTQDVLLKIWMIREQLPHISNPDSYIFMMARNRLIDHFRRRDQRQSYFDAVIIDITVQHPNALNKLIEQDFTTQLHDLLDQLPPRQKEVFNLSRMKGLSHDEIARKLQISNKTVRNHLFTALKFLREKIGREALSH